MDPARESVWSRNSYRMQLIVTAFPNRFCKKARYTVKRHIMCLIMDWRIRNEP